MSASILLLLVMFIASASPFNYCWLHCPFTSDLHILCPRNPIPGLPAALGCSGYNQGFTDEQKGFILTTLNEMRSRVASGLETIGQQPSAANMVELKWDAELEATAQGWALECMMGFNDPCPLLSDESRFSQLMDDDNIPLAPGDARTPAVNMVLRKWYEGVLSFEKEEVPSIPSRTDYELKDKYAQIVWAKTTHVGCGIIDQTAQKEKKYVYRIVCNFKPTGNRNNEEVYVIGKPRSSCPPGYGATSSFKNLCAEGY